jgi:hypothetical protein
MKGQDLSLHVRDPYGPIGRLIFKSLTAVTSPYKGLQLEMDFVPWPSFQQVGAVRWLSLTAVVTDQKVEQRTYGRMPIDLNQEAPPVQPVAPGTVRWLWRLLPEDLDRIERFRHDNPRVGPTFRIEVKGIIHAVDSGPPQSVGGEGTFQVPLSDWEDYLISLGYGVPLAVSESTAMSFMNHPSWAAATTNLELARKRLATGDDYLALEACLSQFEAVVTKPYDTDAWSKLVERMPAQKANSVKALLAAHCQYLNRVGHHRDRQAAAGEDNLQQMPLNHWEAQSAVATSQFLLAYAIRLRG